MAELIGIAELAKELGVPPKTIYGWRTRGVGPRGIKIGKHVRFKRADVDAWLASCYDDPRPAA